MVKVLQHGTLRVCSVGQSKEWQKGPIVLNDWVVFAIEQIDTKPSFDFWSAVTFRECSTSKCIFGSGVPSVMEINHADQRSKITDT